MKIPLSVLSVVLTVLFAAAPFANAASFKLTSTDVQAGKTIGDDFIFNSFGCSGKNLSPELKWTGAPADTKSFAITVYDPDAPTGSGFWHWVAFNIPASTTEIAQNASATGMPAGTIQSRTDFGRPGYGGPCPPAGDKPHRYIFTVYALKDNLQADENASGAFVGFNIHANVLASAKLQAKYGR